MKLEILASANARRSCGNAPVAQYWIGLPSHSTAAVSSGPEISSALPYLRKIFVAPGTKHPGCA
jgi:hypothetical protein